MVTIHLLDIRDARKRRAIVEEKAPPGTEVRVDLWIAQPETDAYRRSTLHFEGIMLGWVRDSHQPLWQYPTDEQPFALHVHKSWDAGRYYGQPHSTDTGNGFVVLINTEDVLSISALAEQRALPSIS